jgi:hypothetical protein
LGKDIPLREEVFISKIKVHSNSCSLLHLDLSQELKVGHSSHLQDLPLLGAGPVRASDRVDVDLLDYVL